MHPESRRAFREAFCLVPGNFNSMGIVMGAIEPLTKGSSSESLSVSPWSPLGEVGVISVGGQSELHDL